MIVLGADLSLTKFGAVISDSPTNILWQGKLVPPKGSLGPKRLCWARDRFSDLVHEYGVELFVPEQYAFASAQSRAHAIGEAGGVIKAEIYELGVDSWDVPIGTLKKYATGTGNASKDDMRERAFKDRGFYAQNEDVADAFWLQDFGQRVLGPEAKKTLVNRKLREKCAYVRGL